MTHLSGSLVCLQRRNKFFKVIQGFSKTETFFTAPWSSWIDHAPKCYMLTSPCIWAIIIKHDEYKLGCQMPKCTMDSSKQYCYSLFTASLPPLPTGDFFACSHIFLNKSSLLLPSFTVFFLPCFLF